MLHHHLKGDYVLGQVLIEIKKLVERAQSLAKVLPNIFYVVINYIDSIQSAMNGIPNQDSPA
jgi:hypothetical protein